MSGISAQPAFPDHSEYRRPPGGVPWSECHRLVAVQDDGSAALALLVTVDAQLGHDTASFHCVVFRSGHDPIVIVASEFEAPAQRWELRTSGLWADTICETPYFHWSYGLEAFGLAIDDPLEMLQRGYGDRVPLGWELEFESSIDQVESVPQLGVRSAGPESTPGPESRPGPESGPGSVTETFGAISQPGHVHGLLLFAAGEGMSFTGSAVRQHWWGPPAAVDMTTLDRLAQIDGEFGTDRSPTALEREVALPLSGAFGGQWWITRTSIGLRSRTVAER